MSRRKSRETAFKVLFQVEQGGAEPRVAFDYMVKEMPLSETEKAFAWTLVEGSLQRMAEIDKKINNFSNEWALERMSSVDRNLMRMAAYEILFLENTSPAVAINEAIEMGKRYGESNSPSFINAILDKIKSDKSSVPPSSMNELE
ncbi:MAG: transcription antitermination factor NusB [Bacillota bacterium]|nr:transcription antitermination factor NusB [Bacillota bacterium]